MIRQLVIDGEEVIFSDGAVMGLEMVKSARRGSNAYGKSGSQCVAQETSSDGARVGDWIGNADPSVDVASSAYRSDASLSETQHDHAVQPAFGQHQH